MLDAGPILVFTIQHPVSNKKAALVRRAALFVGPQGLEP